MSKFNSIYLFDGYFSRKFTFSSIEFIFLHISNSVLFGLYLKLSNKETILQFTCVAIRSIYCHFIIIFMIFIFISSKQKKETFSVMQSENLLFPFEIQPLLYYKKWILNTIFRIRVKCLLKNHIKLSTVNTLWIIVYHNFSLNFYRTQVSEKLI